MRAFPGCFGPETFDGLSLERYSEAYGLAVDFLTEEAEAAREAGTR